MTLEQVKRNMNRQVQYLPLNNRYLLTACVLRINAKGDFFYQAELQDLSSTRSVLICKLEDIQEVIP